MPSLSTEADAFRSTVRRWCEESGEVFTVFRFHAAAGLKQYAFFKSYDALALRISTLPPTTAVAVFRDPQLPLRGRVDLAFVSRAVSELRTAEEWLLVGMDSDDAWPDDECGESLEELEEALLEREGDFIAVGSYPAWWNGDGDDRIGAYTPNPDGTVGGGCY